MVDESSLDPRREGARAKRTASPIGGRILCVGGAVVDTLYLASRPIEPGTSNPVSGARAFGGVARNVAANLKRLGVAVALASVVGDDANGRLILGDLEALGVDAASVEVAPGRRTAEYVAVLEPGRGLHVGLADMGIFDLLSPEIIEGGALNPPPDWVFVDCNATPALIEGLLDPAARGGAWLALDAVSTAKAERLPERLDGLDLLFLNLDEAAAVLRRPAGGLAPEEAVRRLRGRGARAVVLTLGPDGLLLGEASGACARVAARRASVEDVTGAGDALVAATLAGRLAGLPLAEAALLGTCAASLTVGRLGGTHPDLSFERILALAGFAPGAPHLPNP